MLLHRILKSVIIILFIILGIALFQLASPLLTFILSKDFLRINISGIGITMLKMLSIVLGAILGVIVGYLSSDFFIRRLKKLSMAVESQINKTPTQDVMAGLCGLAIGLVLANLLGMAFSGIPFIGPYIPIVFSIVFAYLGIYITIKKRKDLIGLLLAFNRTKERSSQNTESNSKKQVVNQSKPSLKLLDTSVIIDGRIADICKTGFIEGKLLIPIFVLDELQLISDSSDLLKRTRGRRGLDILKRIQTEFDMLVEIYQQDYDDISGVDSKLVRLAQEIGAKIITNDFNLNKVAELQGIHVLNINDLANSIKPVVIPGESMVVTVVKEGKEHNQGVAYLDDGTMIVVEDGHKHLNETLQVMVTSVLQTSAGRMIFAKPKSSIQVM